MTQSPGEYKPSRRDVLRPVEYVGGAAIAAIFTGVVTLVVTRDLTLALIGTGGVFIIVLVALALFAMAIKPDASESAELHEHDAPRVPTTTTTVRLPTVHRRRRCRRCPRGSRRSASRALTGAQPPGGCWSRAVAPARPSPVSADRRGQSRSTSSDAMPV